MSNIVNVFLNELERRGVSIYEFSKKTGIPKTRIYAWKEGRGSPKAEDTAIITTFLNEGKEIGEAEPKNARTYLDERLAIKNGSSEKAIPMYFGNTRAGTIEVYSDDPELNQPVGHLPANIFPSCNHAEKVSGDSMYPLICNQAYVIGKVIDKRGIIWGEKYVIHTSYGQNLVKYIHPSEKGAEFIKIVSHNKTVPPQDLPLDEITFVCRVHFIVNPS